MSADLDDNPGDEEDVDFDLDAEDQLLREAIGQPLRVRVGGQVIEIPHPSDWLPAANTAARMADFDTWAASVLSDRDFKVYTAAGLRNYQLNALFEKVNRRTGTGPGKSPGSRSSSRSTRKR